MQESDYDDTQGLLAELRTRLEDAKYELDRQISEHPFATLGIAFAFGAVLALGPRKLPVDEKRSVSGAITAALAALAIRGVKAYAWSRLRGAAKELLVPSATRERNASRDPSVEAFLEH